MNQITTIRNDLAIYTRYQPQNPVEFTMGEFKCVNEEDVRRIIIAMQSKHCQLDAVSMIIIKMDT